MTDFVLMDLTFLEEEGGSQEDITFGSSLPATRASDAATAPRQTNSEEAKSTGSESGSDVAALPELPECACRYCGLRDPKCLVMCRVCKRWFCNGRGNMNASHIVQHLVRSKHKEIALHSESPAGDSTIECYSCGSKNVFTLGYVPDHLCPCSKQTRVPSLR